jgi:guanylate kinase
MKLDYCYFFRILNTDYIFKKENEVSKHVPRIVVFSGPSGSGKTTLISCLQKITQSVSCISSTTRPPRPDEQNGVSYHFISDAEFVMYRENGDFLEYMTFNGSHYGIRRIDIEIALAQGRDVYMNMSCNGAATIRNLFPLVKTVFILPPSYREVKQRLRDRGMSEIEIGDRFANDDSPIERAVEYDLLIVNHNNKQDQVILLLQELLNI